MADLSINLAGIKSPNPFWVASGPPANTGYQAHRAFEAGWGGVVWKTIGDPIINVASRYSALNYGPQRMIGFNNIELISDRSPETNFREIVEVKKRWPNHAVIASLMVDTRERRDHRVIGPTLLHFHDFAKIGFRRAIADQLDVVEADHPLRPVVQRGVARRHVDDRIADGLPDDTAPSGLECAMRLVARVGRRTRCDPERIGRLDAG